MIDNQTHLRKTSVVTRLSKNMFNFEIILCFILLLIILLIYEANGCFYPFVKEVKDDSIWNTGGGGGLSK